jgi:hypothetical protein
MSCDCSQFSAPCLGGKTQEVPAGSNEDSMLSHYSQFTIATDAPFGNLLKMSRDFKIFGSKTNSKTANYVISCDDGFKACGATVSSSVSNSISERCIISKVIPYYADPSRGLWVVKTIKEVLDFQLSGNKTAEFRGKWGSQRMHKFCLPNTIRVKGTEEFVMYRNGIGDRNI